MADALTDPAGAGRSGLPAAMPTPDGPPRDLPGPSPSVFLLAGEPSGDATGAALARALRQQLPALQLTGVGGQRMRAAGVELLADSSGWAAIGAGDALRKVPSVMRAMARVKDYLRAHPPAVLVTIDAGAVNVRLLRQLSGLPSKKLYYMPPGSWSRKPRSGDLPDLVDAIATPFPWSKDLLSGRRARVEWVGHPVLDLVRPTLGRDDARARYHLDPAHPVVALAPGSRDQEMRYVLPVLAQAAGRLIRDWPGAQFLVPVSRPEHASLVEAAFARAGVHLRLLDGMEYDALQLAQVAAVCSGTATLEFACLGVPLVIVYRASVLTTAQYTLLRGLLGGHKRAGMPNIIADKDIAPELLGRRATPQAIAAALDSYLRDQTKADAARADLAEVRRALGEPGASARTTGMVVDMLASSTSNEGAL